MKDNKKEQAVIKWADKSDMVTKHTSLPHNADNLPKVVESLNKEFPQLHHWIEKVKQ